MCPMIEQEILYLAKSREAMAVAESEYANGRYNNCANRCYDSTLQAAVAALEANGPHAEVRPRDRGCVGG